MSYVLAIDYGTSFTCAAIGVDGRTDVLRFDGGSHLPSHVFLENDGRLSVGKAADSAAARAPERFLRSPKGELGFGALPLGDKLVEPEAAVAAVLREVLTVAQRHENGRPPAEVRLTHPAAWGPKRRGALLDAAARAGIHDPVMLTEPEAAVHHFAHSPRVRIAPGDLIAVYDLGGGTFDTAVLRCTAPNVFELAGPPGGTAGDEGSSEIGGDVFDRRLYEYCGRQVAARDPAAWEAIRKPRERRDRQAQRVLRDDIRKAKESLSSSATPVYVWVERISDDVPISREQLDKMIRGGVEQSIAILEETLAAANVQAKDLSALFLTGGSSRIPLVHDNVKAHFGLADTQDDPKAIVALGAARMDARRTPPQPRPGPKRPPKNAEPKRPPKNAEPKPKPPRPKPQKPEPPKPAPQLQPKPSPEPEPAASNSTGSYVLLVSGLVVLGLALAGVAVWIGITHVLPGTNTSETAGTADSSSLGDFGIWFLWLWAMGIAGSAALGCGKLALEAGEKQ